MWDSNLVEGKSEYSYLQYHWLPTTFTLKSGVWTSSSRYKSRRDGKAIKIRITIGSTVQTTSTVWFSIKWRSLALEIKSLQNQYTTSVVIKVKITRAWSWKLFNWNINLATLSGNISPLWIEIRTLFKNLNLASSRLLLLVKAKALLRLKLNVQTNF